MSKTNNKVKKINSLADAVKGTQAQLKALGRKNAKLSMRAIELSSHTGSKKLVNNKSKTNPLHLFPAGTLKVVQNEGPWSEEKTKNWFMSLSMDDHKSYAKVFKTNSSWYLTRAKKHLSMILKLKAKEAREKLRVRLQKRKKA